MNANPLTVLKQQCEECSHVKYPLVSIKQDGTDVTVRYRTAVVYAGALQQINPHELYMRILAEALEQ